MPDPVLGLVCKWRGAAVQTLHNLGTEAVTIEPADLGASHAITLLSSAEEEERTDGALTLEGSGYRWFRLGRERR